MMKHKLIIIPAMLLVLTGCELLTGLFSSPVLISTLTQKTLNTLAWNCASLAAVENAEDSGFSLANVACAFVPPPTTPAPVSFDENAASFLSLVLAEVCETAASQALVTDEINDVIKDAYFTSLCGDRDGVPSFTRGVFTLQPR